MYACVLSKSASTHDEECGCGRLVGLCPLHIVLRRKQNESSGRNSSASRFYRLSFRSSSRASMNSAFMDTGEDVTTQYSRPADVGTGTAVNGQPYSFQFHSQNNTARLGQPIPLSGTFAPIATGKTPPRPSGEPHNALPNL